MAFEATYVFEGHSIPYTPGSAVAAGEVIVLGAGLIGIAMQDIAASVLGALATEGCYDVAKEASLVVSVGDDIYWDAAANEADKTATNVFMGKAIRASAAADTTVRVKLMPQEGA
jgi:predicted RecA/RadA family phage recombinase